MNFGKLVSGLAALVIYLSLIFSALYFYNIHQTKAKNYVEKNSDRITVTLVNSDKTVFNKKDKTSTPKKPVPKIVIPEKRVPEKRVPKKRVPKKTVPVKRIPKVVIPKKIPKKTLLPKKVLPKRVLPKRVVHPKKKVPKKKVPKKQIPKKVVPKKIIPKKKIPKKTLPPKRVVPKKVIPKKIPAKKKVPKKTAMDLFSSVKTHRVKKRPVVQVPKRPVLQPSAIKHNSSFTNRIQATHQSGRVSNANREKGVENAYIAKVKRHMMNWNAVGARGQWVTVHLTIYNSGKFRYTSSGVSGTMKSSLKRYLDTLNRMGLGRHQKSTPYSIQVRFRVR